MSTLTVIGWIGSALMAGCAGPQAYKTWKTKSADDISYWFLGMWGIGELLTLAYVAPTLNWPLIMNYILNITFLMVILKYKMGVK